MASYTENEKFVQCPYDKSHQILSYRFQTHLVKCAKNHADKNLIVCPFNTTHLYKEAELSKHVTSCPDRATFDVYKVNFNATGEDNANNESKKNPIIQLQLLETGNEENWDDVNEPTYNPTSYVENAPVLRTLYGANPSQRKAFRIAERIRLNNLRDTK